MPWSGMPLTRRSSDGQAPFAPRFGSVGDICVAGYGTPVTMANHTATALSCNTSQKSQLERLESSGKTPQKIALRAQIILKAVAGEGNSAIAKALHISRPTVSLWRNRFTQVGVANQCEKRKFGGR